MIHSCLIISAFGSGHLDQVVAGSNRVEGSIHSPTKQKKAVYLPGGGLLCQNDDELLNALIMI
jgi:hypothetical protein